MSAWSLPLLLLQLLGALPTRSHSFVVVAVVLLILEITSLELTM